MLEAFSLSHVVFAAVALLALPVPFLTRKGALPHRASGWVYAAAQLGIGVTGSLICIHRLRDANPENDAFAVFLLFVALLTGASTYVGTRAFRAQRGGARRVDELVALALLLGGLALGAYALHQRHALYLAFSAFGVFQGAGQLRYWRRKQWSRAEALIAHVNGMGGSAIGTLTAFVVVNGQKLGFAPGSLWLWLTPGLMGGTLLAWWQRRYRAKLVNRAIPATE
jgi:hypothetical protein